MGINIIGGAASSAASSGAASPRGDEYFFTLPNANTPYYINIAEELGGHTGWVTLNFSRPTTVDQTTVLPEVTQRDVNLNIISTHSAIDTDSSNTFNRSEVTFALHQNAKYLRFNNNISSLLLNITLLQAPSTNAKVPTISSYNTSQNVTITQTSQAVLIGGGGSGAKGQRSGGGGSGFRTVFTIEPGTYSLVVGGGGGGYGSGGGYINGNAGGTSYFSNYEAAGGNGGIGGGAGGYGGSGGGGSFTQGGYNGNRGSGQTMPIWTFEYAANSSDTPANTSQGGAIYGGGGGGNEGGSGSSGRGIGGGGGGAGEWYAGSGSGASGGLLVLNF